MPFIYNKPSDVETKRNTERGGGKEERVLGSGVV